jgi:hypothetical protein
VTTYGMGRLPFTADFRDYPMARLQAMLKAGEAKPVAWSNKNHVLDQEDHPFCVAFGTLGLLNTDDEMHNDPHFGSAEARDFFATIPNADPLRGAYVRDGLKAAKAQGLVAAYALLRTDNEVDEWLSNHGPVLVGTAWTEQMTTPLGDIVVVDTAESDAGHCYFWHGQDTYYRLGTNSWGEGWGLGGKFKMRRADDSKLRRAGGEAWAVIQPVAPPKASCWQRLRTFFKGG